MSKVDLAGVANRLFDGFLAPLVVGGEMLPGRPIGARVALVLGHDRVIANGELASFVEVARTRVARRLAAIDRVDPPTPAEWALGAALHDLVQATHPQLYGALRRRTPGRILTPVEATAERVPAAASIGEALSRHSWFARLLEIQRTDTVVRWWVGSRTFLGTTPPTRLTAWPELRRVNIERTPRPLMDLSSTAPAFDAPRFSRTLVSLLAKMPLTDLATAHRASPAFAWTAETLGLVAARAGQTLAMRALALAPAAQVDAALGRATRELLKQRAWRAAGVALDLLGQRALAEAQAFDGSGDRGMAAGTDEGDAAFARAAGALLAQQSIATHGGAFPERERQRLLIALEPRARTTAARELAALLAAGELPPAPPPAA